MNHMKQNPVPRTELPPHDPRTADTVGDHDPIDIAHSTPITNEPTDYQPDTVPCNIDVDDDSNLSQLTDPAPAAAPPIDQQGTPSDNRT